MNLYYNQFFFFFLHLQLFLQVCMIEITFAVFTYNVIMSLSETFDLLSVSLLVIC